MHKRKTLRFMSMALIGAGAALGLLSAVIGKEAPAQSYPPGWWTANQICEIDGNQTPCPGTPGMGPTCDDPNDPNNPNTLILYCSNTTAQSATPPSTCADGINSSCHNNATAGQCPTERSCATMQPTTNPPSNGVETYKTCNSINGVGNPGP